MTAGLFIILFGIFFYISSRFCAGSRDSLMVAIERKNLAVVIKRTVLKTSAVFIVWLLGGPVDIGTILPAFGISFLVQTVFSLLKFDPAKIHRKTFYAT